MPRGRSLAFTCWQRLHFTDELLSAASKCRRFSMLNQSPSLHKSYALSIRYFNTEVSAGTTDPIISSALSVEAHWGQGNSCKSNQDITKASAKSKYTSFYTDKIRERLTDFEGREWEAATEKALGEFSDVLTADIVANVVKSTEADMAKNIFEWAGRQESYKHSRHCYNMLFRNFIRAQNFESGIQILKEMKEHGFTINPKTFVTLVHHYGKAGMMSAVSETPDLMKSFGFVPDHRIYGALVNAFLQVNDQDRANKLIQKILDEGIMLDIDSFNYLLSTCARGAEVDQALRILENMEIKGCTPNIHTYNIIIKWFCKAERPEEALKLLKALRENGLVPNVTTYNILISAFGQKNKLNEASNLFAEMTRPDCCPDDVTHSCLLSSYLKFGLIEKALLHLEKLSAEGTKPKGNFERICVAHLCEANKVDNALQLFETASDRGDRMALQTCNTILVALCKARRLDDALKMLEKMKRGVCNPDLSSYTILVGCCCNLFRLDKARQLYSEAKSKGLKFSVDTCVKVLHSFSRASKMREVGELCEDLLIYPPNFVGKKGTAILDALNIAQWLDGALKFCNYVMENNLKIQPRQLNRLVYLLHKKDRSSEASNLLREMMEKGCVVSLETLSSKTVDNSNVEMLRAVQ